MTEEVKFGTFPTGPSVEEEIRDILRSIDKRLAEWEELTHSTARYFMGNQKKETIYSRTLGTPITRKELDELLDAWSTESRSSSREA